MAKTLAELATLVEGAVINGDKDLTIEDIEHDSRKITQGALFVCMEGVHVDGHKFIYLRQNIPDLPPSCLNAVEL